MRAQYLLTGETVCGEVYGELFIHERDRYTGDCEVYKVGEEVEIIDDADDTLQEIDSNYSDALRVISFCQGKY